MNDKKMNDKEQADEMLKRIERLKAQSGAAPAAPAKPANDQPKTLAEAESALAQAQRASRVFNEVATTWDAVTRPIKTAWTYIKPTIDIGMSAASKLADAFRFAAPVVKPFWNGYKALFNRVAYTKDEDGERTVLNKPRALVAGVLSLAMAFGAVTYGGPFMGNMAYDAAFMPTTMKTEQVYLTGANPSDDTDEVFYVKGCESLPCDSQTNSVYYRLRDSFPYSMYQFATSGKFFYPEHVGSAISEGVNQCTITTYGMRLPSLGMYPHILKAQCMPLGIDSPAPAPGGP